MLAEHPARVDMTVHADFEEYQAFRSPKLKPVSSAETAVERVVDELSPSEAVGHLVEE